jgi:ABC-type transporter Mla MlaB component
MADKKDKSVIGFDPLAWMNDEEDAKKTEEQQENQKVVESFELVNNDASEVIIEASVEKNNMKNEGSTIVLDATLNIQKVTVLYEQLKPLLDNQNTIEIDASAVATIDTATLQLLIVLKQTAVKLHKEIIIDFPSDKFIEAAELLDLVEILEVDQAAAGFF